MLQNMYSLCMTNIVLKRQALLLREQGKSYSQIRGELGISKSTLSEWLRKFPLSKDQVQRLRDRNDMRIEKFRQTMKQKREKKLLIQYKKSKKILLPLSDKELFLAGIFLYWGEGGKTEQSLITISNTDPTVLQFSLLWMQKALKIKKNRIRVLLHLYKDMDIQESIHYWSKTLGIPKSHFTKPYIKKTNKANLDEKGFGYGTCNIRVNDSILKSRILMTIKAMADYSGTFYNNNLI